MSSPTKLIAVYLDMPQYIKPKEIRKVFRLYQEYLEVKDDEAEPEAKEELLLLLNVLTAADNRSFQLSTWKRKGKDVAILEIFESIETSLFSTPQDELYKEPSK